MSGFDQEFEESVLAQCLRDEQYLKKAVRVCEAHHFATGEMGWMWRVIADVWRDYRERCNAKLVLSRAMVDFPAETKRKPYLALALKLFKTKPAAPKAALDELTRFVRSVTYQISLEEAARALEKGKLDDVESTLSRAAHTHIAERPWTHINWFDSFVERQVARKYERDHPDEFTCIPTGIPQLDRALSGGARIGEVGLIMGTTGRGKSVMLSNVCYTSVVHSFDAVYFALEMPARQVATRMDARWSGFKYDQFKTHDFKPSEIRSLAERYKRFRKRLKNRFHVLSMPVKSADITTVRAALEDLKNEYGFTPSLVAIDSGDHMRATDRSLDSYRLQQAEVYWDLKRLAEEQGYVVWSTVHAGREWAHQIATAEAASESYDKARIADLIVSLNDPNSKPARRKRVMVSTDDDDDESEEPGEVKGFEGNSSATQLLEIYLAKYRDGVSKLRIDVTADFARMVLREKDEEEAEGDDEAA
jgi:replicative DNA helicase